MNMIRLAHAGTMIALLLVVSGCQSPPKRITSVQGGILMSQPLLKMSGKVGDAQYEPFELGPISHRIGANAVASTVTIGGAPFTVIGPKMEPVLNALTLVHEAQRDRNLAQSADKAAFLARLKELFQLHGTSVGATMVTMNGTVLEL